MQFISQLIANYSQLYLIIAFYCLLLPILFLFGAVPGKGSWEGFPEKSCLKGQDPMEVKRFSERVPEKSSWNPLVDREIHELNEKND